MKQTDLEAIYKANVGVGHLEALEAVYAQGWHDGAGLTVNSSSVSPVPNRPAPAVIFKQKTPDLR